MNKNIKILLLIIIAEAVVISGLAIKTVFDATVTIELDIEHSDEGQKNNFFNEATKEMREGYYGMVRISKVSNNSYFVFIGAVNDTTSTTIAFGMDINRTTDDIFMTKSYFDETSWSGFNFSKDEDFYLSDLDYLYINYEEGLRVVYNGERIYSKED